MHARLGLAALAAALAALLAGCGASDDGEPVHVVDDPPPAREPQLRLEPVVELDEGQEAVAVARHPVDEAGLLVVTRHGRILEVRGDRVAGDPWLDLRDRIDAESNYERGLLGLAVGDGRAFVSFTDRAGDSNVVSYRLDDAGRPRPGSERTLLHLDQPGPVHNGGGLSLTDGDVLWVALGDGGAGTAEQTSQDPGTLLGSILRLDVTPGAGEPYAVPADNPMVDDPDAAPETYVYGLRNPWGFWVDERSGNLWIGDVGEARYEEVSVVGPDDAGANLGWPWREGHVPLEGEPEGAGPLHEPLLVYHHDALGCAIAGGAIADDGPEPVRGAYLFGDLCQGHVVAVHLDDGRSGDPRVTSVERVAQVEAGLTSVSVVEDGVVYVTTRQPGAVLALRAS